MRFGARQASTELTFLAWLSATCRATNRQDQLWDAFHGSHHALERAKKMVNSAQFSAAHTAILDFMANIKFVVRVNHGTRAPAYVQQVDRFPLQMTTNRKLALIMGKLTAEDTAKSLQNSRCTPELLPVEVSA
jgi:hypothetical protein